MSKKQLGLILFFTALLITGLILGDSFKVWGKAIRICLECIGIG
ncbi:CD1871A family CXXC motif-containing protein [Planctomycetota bacterium]